MKYIISYSKHPRKNLPNGRKRKESDFVLSFGRAYREEIENTLFKNDIFELAREVYIPSFGIADIVSILRKKNETILYAFEMKIKGWRKALAQAYRYKYYADIVYVVLPFNEAEKAIQSLEIFQKLNIGLLAFDDKKMIIKCLSTPANEKPLSPAAHDKVLKLLSKTFKSLPSL